ncbi:MAG: PepSY domain-containing protein, partial [Candidatus Omnitrophica bacterium]|nr:PepSY domain-containing protein [Candidatus Omnitrophota bacterium]
MKLRNFHRLLGLFLFLFILNASLSGVFRANAKWWYWKDRPAKKEAAFLAPPTVDFEEAFKIYQSRFPEGQILQIELKSLLGKPVYLFQTDRPQAKYVLMSAASGEILSPIGLELAIQIARSFVNKSDALALSENLPSFKARKANEPRPVFRIVFRDTLKTEIFVDQETAQPILILDRGRRFGLWIVKL